MSAQLVDSHCHLDLLDFAALGTDLDGVMAQAREHGVGNMLCVGIKLETLPKVLAVAGHYPNVYASVGVHPNEHAEEQPDVAALVLLSRASDKIIAIGETGLDYYRSEGDLAWQRERFCRHIAAAREVGKPLIIHSRAAREDTLRIIREENADQVGGVMHCFTEDWDMARQAMDLNFYISFSGIVTFSSAKTLKDVATRMPLERMLVETDSPYLAPVPFRGKTNQPAYVRHVAQHIADLRGIPVEQVIEATTRNFVELFSPPQFH
jgi:TatD DNase family protein